MTAQSFHERARIRQLDRPALSQLQLEKLNRLLSDAQTNNEFYQRKLAGCPKQLSSVDQLAELPITTKEELQPPVGDEPFAANRTFPVDQYVRCHQTSGTRGRPLVVLDTADDWQWWIESWQYVLDAAQVTPSDRVLLAFSFGPFIGFWSAFDSLTARGALVIPGGGLSSLSRIELIRLAKVTTVCCTPTYAMRLAEVAVENSINLCELPVEKIIVAGEPGGSVATIRQRIESAWDARVIDHGGATEVGPWGFGDSAGRGLYVNESHFLPEFVSVATGRRANEGELSHLILTALGRWGAPVIRYRTGDLVRPVWSKNLHLPLGEGRGEGALETTASNFVFLDGGIVGRADDMLIIRGMNIYPTAIEQILHCFPEVVEYRITARNNGAMDELVIEVEDHLQRPARIADELRLKLGLKIDVRTVSAMSLPRFEGKGRRFIDERQKQSGGDTQTRRQGEDVA
jgi:phenylacetate-CoA ligase